MLTLRTISKLTNGQQNLSVDFDTEVSGFSIDTRTLKAGNVFIALQGETDHGNRFVDKAKEQGAVAIITDQQPESNALPYILVEDSLKALTQIGIYQRELFKGKVCGVTGTVGKTGVKEALSFLFGKSGFKVHASEKSYNNHIGVPLTLANLDLRADIAVFEMGMNHPGEILALTRLVRPEVAIVTAVGPGHIEFFDSVEAIAKEKVSIAATLIEDGVAILPADSEYFSLMNDIVKNEYHHKVMSFGASETSSVRVESVDLVGVNKLQVSAKVMDIPVSYDLPTSNYAWVNNTLAILATAYAVGVDVKQMVKYFSEIPFVDGRGRVSAVQLNGKEITVIDDAYNANPLSMKSSLDTLSKYPGRKIAVIGDMLELGDFSKKYHVEIGQVCKALGIDKVLTCGALMEDAYQELLPSQQLAHVQEYSEVLRILKDTVQDGDIVMIKASNGVKLHKVVAELLSA